MKIMIYFCIMMLKFQKPRVNKAFVAVCLMMLCSLVASASYNYSLRNRLIDLWSQFAGEVAGRPDEARALNALKSGNVSDSLAFDKMTAFGREMFIGNKRTIAFSYLRTAIEILDEYNDLPETSLRFKAACYLILGCAVYEDGMYQLALDYYFKGLGIVERFGSLRQTGPFYNNIGVIYLCINDYDKAEVFFNKSLNANLKMGKLENVSISYRNVSETRMKKGDLDGALDYALKALQVFKNDQYPDEYYSGQAYLGSLYMLRKEYDMARTWLRNAYSHQRQQDNKSDLFDTCLLLIKLSAETGQSEAVTRYRDEAEKLADISGNPALRMRLYSESMDMFSSQRDISSAFDTARKLLALKDSLYNSENIARMESAITQHELELKKDVGQPAMKRWNPVTVFFFMASVVLILAGLLAWLIIKRKKKERLLAEKEEANAALAAAMRRRIEDERLQNQQAERDISDHQRRLTAITLRNIETSRQIEEALAVLKQVLLKIPARDHESQQKLKNVIKQFEDFDNEGNWEEFQHYFTLVHPDFYRRLDSSHPGLTPGNRKLCALIALGLSTKDIASITFRSIRSVETSRNRLRKELQISSDVNLEDYMHRFAIAPERETDAERN